MLVKAFVGFSLFAAVGVLAQVGDILYSPGQFDIIWTVTTPGQPISLLLRQGPSDNIGLVGTIADSIANTGSYEWNIPPTLPSGTNYAIEIIVGPASNVSNVGPADYNFTPLLQVVGNYTGSATLGGASSNSTVTSSSSGSLTSATSTLSSSISAGNATVTKSASSTSSTLVPATVTRSTSNPSSTASSTATAKSGAMSLHVENGLVAFVLAMGVALLASF